MTFPYPDSYVTEGAEIEFTYDSRFDDGRLTFFATTTGREKVLVKFTRRYLKEAHQYCAEARVAPKLLDSGLCRQDGIWLLWSIWTPKHTAFWSLRMAVTTH